MQADDREAGELVVYDLKVLHELGLMPDRKGCPLSLKLGLKRLSFGDACHVVDPVKLQRQRSTVVRA